MPAQWPTFIKNVSDRLVSNSKSSGPDSRDEFALFVATEYFNAVNGKAQSPFGDTHVPGQKAILDNGFKKAFKEIYENERIEFDDKFTMPAFAEFNEPTVVPNFKTDPLCDILNCINQSKDTTVEYVDFRSDGNPTKTHTYSKFKYFPLFPSLCPVPYTDEIDFTGGINMEDFISEKIADEQGLINEAENKERLFVTMTILGFAKGVDYQFLYSINGEDQSPLTADENGIVVVPVSLQPGEYQYTFKSVLDSEGNLVKNINKTVTGTIDEIGKSTVVNILEDESDKNEPTPKFPEIVKQNIGNKNNKDFKEFLADSIVERVLLQNDESENFKKWAKSLSNLYGIAYGSYARTIGDMVWKKIEELQKTVNQKLINEGFFGTNQSQRTRNVQSTLDKIYNAHDIKDIRDNSEINQYAWQPDSEFDPDLPDWLNKKFIAAFTYDKSVDVFYGGDVNRWQHLASQRKVANHKTERDRWFNTLTACVSNKEFEQTGGVGGCQGDGYDTMAETIINYWKSCTVQPLKKSPPIPPCNTTAPLGGIYAPIYYGDKCKLAGNLRKAWNNGKKFRVAGLHRPPANKVATAVAAACSLHLLELKFIYLGGITTPGGPVPMIGFMPTVF